MQASLQTVFLLLLWQSHALAEPLNGEEIKALFTGNTVAGIYTSGERFSEFHSADGRALGDNGFTLNVDACWNVDQNKVCYHYGPAKERRTYCFAVEREGDSIRLRTAETGRINAVALIEQGNPRNHEDGGRRWSCDDLLSRFLPSPSVHPASAAGQRQTVSFSPALLRVFSRRRSGIIAP